MDVRLLYFDGCPNWQVADDRLREALRIVGSSDEVHLVQVPTPDEAERLSFRGSPTILLDGRDPFADETAPVGLSCRVFARRRGCVTFHSAGWRPAPAVRTGSTGPA